MAVRRLYFRKNEENLSSDKTRFCGGADATARDSAAAILTAAVLNAVHADVYFPRRRFKQGIHGKERYDVCKGRPLDAKLVGSFIMS